MDQDCMQLAVLMLNVFRTSSDQFADMINGPAKPFTLLVQLGVQSRPCGGPERNTL